MEIFYVRIAIAELANDGFGVCSETANRIVRANRARASICRNLPTSAIDLGKWVYVNFWPP